MGLINLLGRLHKQENKWVMSQASDSLTHSTGYVISLNSLQCPEDVLAWVKHLSDKQWFDKQSLIEFLFYAEELLHTEFNINETI